MSKGKSEKEIALAMLKVQDQYAGCIYDMLLSVDSS